MGRTGNIGRLTEIQEVKTLQNMVFTWRWLDATLKSMRKDFQFVTSFSEFESMESLEASARRVAWVDAPAFSRLLAAFDSTLDSTAKQALLEGRVTTLKNFFKGFDFNRVTVETLTAAQVQGFSLVCELPDNKTMVKVLR